MSLLAVFRQLVKIKNEKKPKRNFFLGLERNQIFERQSGATSDRTYLTELNSELNSQEFK